MLNSKRPYYENKAAITHLIDLACDRSKVDEFILWILRCSLDKADTASSKVGRSIARRILQEIETGALQSKIDEELKLQTEATSPISPVCVKPIEAEAIETECLVPLAKDDK
jgi:hypothetical protein